MKVKVESENVGLKFNIQKTKIMASSPITSWQTCGETVETVSDFIFGAPKSLQMVTAAMKLKDTYSLEFRQRYNQIVLRKTPFPGSPPGYSSLAQVLLSVPFLFVHLST